SPAACLQQGLPREAGPDRGGQHRPIEVHAASIRSFRAAAGLRGTPRTVPCGLPFADRKVRPIYSPITPRIMDCTPATSRITVMVDAQPDGVSWVYSASKIVAAVPIAPSAAMAMPAIVANRNGAREKLVARFSHS